MIKVCLYNISSKGMTLRVHDRFPCAPCVLLCTNRDPHFWCSEADKIILRQQLGNYFIVRAPVFFYALTNLMSLMYVMRWSQRRKISVKCGSDHLSHNESLFTCFLRKVSLKIQLWLFSSFGRNFKMKRTVALREYIMFSVWGISSNGRAPALHAGGTGINTRIFHFFFSLLLLLLFIHNHI